MMLERIWNLSGKPRSTVHSERLSWRFLDLDAPNSGCSQTSYPQRLSGRRLINTHIFVTRIRSNRNKLEYSKELQILVCEIASFTEFRGKAAESCWRTMK